MTSTRTTHRALALFAALALMALGLVTGAAPERAPPRSGPTDLGLYRYAAAQAVHPGAYYPRLIAEQRREGYELRPFLAVRPPALSFLLAALKTDAIRRGALMALALASLLAWRQALGGETLPGVLTSIALATGVLPAIAAEAPYLHEVWAGVLISLSLALRRPHGFAAAVALGLAAALIRELAAPYLLAMLALALTERRWREGAAWASALVLFGAALALHAHLVGRLVLPSDHASVGWLKLSGWPFVLHAAQWNGLLAVAPAWLAAVVVPLALFGAATWDGPLGRRLAAILIGYVLAFAVVGRPENFHWGLVFTPLLPLGLVRAVASAADYLNRSRGMASPRAA